MRGEMLTSMSDPVVGTELGFDFYLISDGHEPSEHQL